MSSQNCATAGESFKLSAFQICLLIGSGVLAASQIGKTVISMPAIRAEMGFGYAVAGFIMATFATLGAAMGIGAGALVARVGMRTALIGGMFVVSAGTFAGAIAPNGLLLLLARVVEGIGFFGVVLSVPTALAQIGDAKKRDVIMALWSAYMPAGIMIFLALGSLLPILGWRTLWLADAAVTSICACLLIIKAPRVEIPQNQSTVRQLSADILEVVRDGKCLVLAGTFFAYSCQIFSLAFALPLVLTSKNQFSAASIGILCSGVLLVSTLGHLSSSWLVRAAIPTWKLLVASFTCFAISAIGIYAASSPALEVVLLSAAALGVGGLAPGALYAAAPNIAPTKRTIPVTIGMLQQASNLGQFAGPLVLGLCAEHWGWRAAPLIATPIALAGLALSLLIPWSSGSNAPIPSALPTDIKPKSQTASATS
jgi:DHA1 family inner membrane transport protein